MTRNIARAARIAGVINAVASAVLGMLLLTGGLPCS